MSDQATRLRTQGPLPGARISFTGAVGATSPVAHYLPTDRGGRAPKRRRNPAYRSTRGNAARDLLALLQAESQPSSPAHRGGNASIQSQYAVGPALLPPAERPRNIGDALPVLPALPELGLLLRREPRPCDFLHTHTSSSGKIRRCCVDPLNSPPKADIGL